MYTNPNLYVYKSPRLFMAKLYWRYKKDSRWTWLAAEYEFMNTSGEWLVARVRDLSHTLNSYRSVSGEEE